MSFTARTHLDVHTFRSNRRHVGRGVVVTIVKLNRCFTVGVAGQRSRRLLRHIAPAVAAVVLAASHSSDISGHQSCCVVAFTTAATITATTQTIEEELVRSRNEGSKGLSTKLWLASTLKAGLLAQTPAADEPATVKHRTQARRQKEEVSGVGILHSVFSCLHRT